jgi:5-(carboxyamino)imidazole ribonucleotide synthase
VPVDDNVPAPPPTIGVVGAGQLGRMLHQAAIGPGLRLRFLAASAGDCTVAVHPDHDLGSALDAAALTAFAGTVDVVTFEHEVIDLEALDRLVAAGAVLRPGPQAMRAVADKLDMRAAVAAAGLPIPPWRRADTVVDVVEALADWPDAVLKLSRGGYDGRGVFMVSGVDEARAVAGEVFSAGTPLLVEPRLAFEAEAAVIVARRPGGETVVYDPVATTQVDGQCRQVVAPSGLGDAIDEQARSMGQAVAEALDVVGLVAVEFFVVDGELSVNELAVRPHNTGHHGIDACVTSQFENHLRAVADLPLGDPRLRSPAAMVNVIGDGDVDPRDRLAAAMALDSGARIHLYGKGPRHDRKLGHVTVCDIDVERAAERAWRVVAALGGQKAGSGA